MKKYYIIADVGGTHSNFALLELNTSSKYKFLYKRMYPTTSFNSFDEIVSDFKNYCSTKLKVDVRDVVFAVAGRIMDNRVKMTNTSLVIDAEKLQKTAAIRNIRLINDFYALGLAIPSIERKFVKTINKGCKSTINKSKILIGVGTGLGKSIIVCDDKSQKYKILPSEGGHIDFPIDSIEEFGICNYIKKKYKKDVVEEEDLLSGRGLEHIYEYLSGKKLEAKTISHNKSKDKFAKKTFEYFYRFLARVSKNFAIETLSLGGVYIAGGIIQNNIKFSKKDFIKEFIRNDNYSSMLKQIPIYVIKDYDVSLRGIVNYIDNFEKPQNSQKMTRKTPKF